MNLWQFLSLLKDIEDAYDRLLYNARMRQNLKAEVEQEREEWRKHIRDITQDVYERIHS